MSLLQVIDGHCHIASMRYIPKKFLLGVADNMLCKAQAYGNNLVNRNSLLDLLIAQHQDDYGDNLIKEMDAAGIHQTVLLFPDFGESFDHLVDPETAIEEHLSICERHEGRFHLFAAINPTRENALENFAKFLPSKHLKGLKFYPSCGYSISDPILYQYYELCSEINLPVLFHSGPTSPVMPFQFTSPYDVDRAAYLFPKVNFIMGHGGVHNTEQAIQLCAYRPNCYMDISSFVNTLYPGGWVSQLAELFNRKINHKIIFGTDWPVAKKIGGLKSLMEAFLNPEAGPLANINKIDTELILSKNMLRLMNINNVVQ